jgi:serine/threonine protein kinase
VQIVGDYELLERIAEGGMGTVYKARHKSTGAVVALKLVSSHLASNPVLMKRFEQEYNVASTLNHPNIVRALAFGRSGSAPYLVMEYVEGESLGRRLERAGRMPEAEAIRIMVQVAQGLHRAHKQGLIHRDVKPDNIVLTADGQAKLVDLGLVKELDADLNLTRTGRGLGTPHFMAPEQFRDAKNADARCDIYSMAATLYMMVTGELPFKSLGPVDAWVKKLENKLPPPRQVVPSLSERVDWAIQRSMNADRDLRPATCREFVEDLTGRSTRRIASGDEPPAEDVWFVTYRDKEGVVHTVKGNTTGIRRNLKEGLMGDPGAVRAGRSKSGPREPLKSHPEFRDLVIGTPLSPSPVARPAPPPSRTTPVLTPPAPAKAGAAAVVKAQPVRPAPHIDLGEKGRQPEWLLWVVLALVAVGAAIAGLYFLPTLP